VTPCIWLGTTHPCNPSNYGLWVNLHFFMMCIYKHCFPPMLLVFAMKRCTKMPCRLHQPLLLLASFTYMLASPARLYMPYLFTHCLPTIICVMLMSIAFFYFCHVLHFFVTPFWFVCVHIFSFVSILVSFSVFSIMSLPVVNSKLAGQYYSVPFCSTFKMLWLRISSLFYGVGRTH